MQRATRWRWVAGLAALACALGTAWWMGRGLQAGGGLPSTSDAALAAGVQPPNPGFASAPSPSVPALAAAGPLRDEGAADAASDAVWDLCGVGRLPKPVPAVGAAPVPAEFALDDLPAHFGSDALVQARQGLLRALDAGSPRERAAAMVLRASAAVGHVAAAGLPALALTTDDPVIDLWAMHSCGPKAACAEPLAQRWVQHDASNLAAWAAVLEQTPVPQRDEVVARMARATHLESYGPALAAVALQAMPDHVPAYLQVPLLLETLAMGAAAVGSLQGTATYCRQPLPPASAAFTHCAAIARVMVERSDTVLGALVGLQLAERTYMPAPEAQRQREAIRAAPSPHGQIFEPQQGWSCTGVQRMRKWVQLLAAHGEQGAAQTLAAMPAKPAADR